MIKMIIKGDNIVAIILFAALLTYAFQVKGEEKKKQDMPNSNTIVREMMSVYPEQPKKSLNDEEKEDLRRDPFSAIRSLLYKRDRPTKNRVVSDIGFEPGERPGAIPKMSLKGHLQAKDGEIVALLEIEGSGVHIVREGDAVGLHDLGYDSVIRIREISRLHLVIESGSLGKLIIVR